MLNPIGNAIQFVVSRVDVRGNSEPDPDLGDIPTETLVAQIRRQRVMLIEYEWDQTMREQFIQRADAELARRGVVL